MTDGIVNIIAHNLSRGESDFKVSRRLLSGENALLVEQGVFVASNEYYREYDCPCGNGTSMITRIGSPGYYRYEAACSHEDIMQDLPVDAEDVELMCFDVTAYRKCASLAEQVDEAVKLLKGNAQGVIVTHFSNEAKAELRDATRNKGGRPPRTKHSFSQKQIAKIFGVSEQTVYKWEHGLAGGPKGYTAEMRKTGDLEGLLKCVVEYNRLKDFKDVLNTKDIIRDGFNEEEIAAINGKIQELLQMKRRGEDILKTLT